MTFLSYLILFLMHITATLSFIKIKSWVVNEKESELFYFNKQYYLILRFSKTVGLNEHSKHPENNEQFNGTYFERHTTIGTSPNLPNSILCSTLESISYLHENFELSAFSARVESFSI